MQIFTPTTFQHVAFKKVDIFLTHKCLNSFEGHRVIHRFLTPGGMLETRIHDRLNGIFWILTLLLPDNFTYRFFGASIHTADKRSSLFFSNFLLDLCNVLGVGGRKTRPAVGLR